MRDYRELYLSNPTLTSNEYQRYQKGRAVHKLNYELISKEFLPHIGPEVLKIFHKAEMSKNGQVRSVYPRIISTPKLNFGKPAEAFLNEKNGDTGCVTGDGQEGKKPKAPSLSEASYKEKMQNKNHKRKRVSSPELRPKGNTFRVSSKICSEKSLNALKNLGISVKTTKESYPKGRGSVKGKLLADTVH